MTGLAAWLALTTTTALMSPALPRPNPVSQSAAASIAKLAAGGGRVIQVTVEPHGYLVRIRHRGLVVIGVSRAGQVSRLSGKRQPGSAFAPHQGDGQPKGSGHECIR